MIIRSLSEDKKESLNGFIFHVKGPLRNLTIETRENPV